MASPPRRPDQKLFDRSLLVRGLWQGAGLLLLLLAVHAAARAWLPADDRRDDVARALTFTVLVLSNLGLIHANRSWGRTLLRGSAESNLPFGWISAGAVVLLGAVLGVPAIGRLFAFAPPAPGPLLAAVGAAGLGMAWFEAVKRVQARSARRSP